MAFHLSASTWQSIRQGTPGSAIPPYQPKVRSRRGDFRANPLEAAKYYIPEYVPDDYAPDHYNVIKLMQLRGRLVVILLPRGFGKGTISLIDTFHAIAFGTERYIVRIEHDRTASRKEMQKIIKIFQTNQRVIADFGHLLQRIVGSSGELYFTNGTFYRCIGQDQLVRGTTHLEKRLSVASINDLIANAKEARSPSKNQDAYNLITHDVGKAGEAYKDMPLRQYYLGTCMAKNDLADLLCQHAMSLVYKFPAIDGDPQMVQDLLDLVSEDIPNIQTFVDAINATGASVTSNDHRQYVESHALYHPFLAALTSRYPARFPMWDLIFDMAEGTDVFAQEMMHITGDTKFEKYHENWFQQYDGTLPNLRSLEFGIAIDLAGEPKDGTDPCVVFGAAIDTRNDRIYPISGSIWCDQGTDLEVIDHTYKIYHLLKGHTTRQVPVLLEGKIGDTSMKTLFETVRQKKILEGEDPKYWCELPIKVIPQTENKIERILRFRREAEQRKVYYIPSDPGHRLMKTQFLNFNGEPTHKHLPITMKIDIPDMVELFFRCMRSHASVSPDTVEFPQTRREIRPEPRPDMENFLL